MYNGNYNLIQVRISKNKFTGLIRSSTKEHLVRAILKSIAYQTIDLLKQYNRKNFVHNMNDNKRKLLCIGWKRAINMTLLCIQKEENFINEKRLYNE